MTSDKTRAQILFRTAKKRAAKAAALLTAKKVRALLKYANPYAASTRLEPCPATPQDFLDANYKPLRRFFDDKIVPLDPEAIRAALARDTAPIPATMNREGYLGDNHLAYWISGYTEYKRLEALAAKYGVHGGTMFDFGGSTGRLFRHFHFQSEGNWKAASCDFKLTSVEWNLEHFPSGIQAFQGMYFPVLPVEDRSYDLITAMSVFTHIDETETSWLMELRRVTKPGGILALTVHNEDHWPNMPQALREIIAEHDPAFLKNETLPEGRFVSTFTDDDPYRCNTFHSNSYIHKQWSRFFTVLDILPQFSGAQSAVILRREPE